ncbi:MAG: PDZ domain-containing protein [Elusimicrobia bacterium]|nr:PDZ domain-containing protein [Elusimicrobiota bacterium]
MEGDAPVVYSRARTSFVRASLLLLAAAQASAPVRAASGPAEFLKDARLQPVADVGVAAPAGPSQAVLDEIAETIAEQYVEPISKETFAGLSIERIMARLDPNSRYLTPEQVLQFGLDQLNRSYVGVGVMLDKASPADPLVVVYPIPGAPADGRLDPGDRITAVNGMPVAGLPREDAVALFRGRSGDPVAVAVEGKPEPVTITRGRVPTVVAHGDLLAGDVGYLYVGSFPGMADKEIWKVMKRLNARVKELSDLSESAGGPARALRGLVIDLRDCPGGDIEASLFFMSYFLHGGMPVLQIEHRGSRQVIGSPRDGLYPDLPLAVLVNGRTASSAEIVAAALQDHKRAVIVGSRTFKKGSVQKPIPLQDGSMLRLTTDRWLSPSGRSVEGAGVEPDAPVAVEAAAERAAMQDVVRRAYGGEPSAAPPPDPALAVALRRLAER